MPIIVFPVAYKICKELQTAPLAGKRKSHNVVMRTAEGAYVAVPVEQYPGYQEEELEPVDVDEVDLVSALAADAETNPPGVYRVPREYR